MDLQQRTKWFGLCLILLAVLLRLASPENLSAFLAWLQNPRTPPLLVYIETGRTVRFSSSEAEPAAFARESPEPWIPEEARPVFSSGDAEAAELSYACSVSPDVEALLSAPLEWNLADGEPAVLILHTHATESYTRQKEPYVESSDYRTLNETYNMVSIGERVAQLLEEQGIAVIHDREFHDYPSYNGSYVHARSAIEDCLRRYPSIRLVLDLHRDASGSPGNQLRTEVSLNGRTAAQLMLVIGTGAGGQTHPGWEENLSLALKLQVLLERQCPGIMRPISLRSQRFNQDLSPGALLVEVGAAGNTHGEAMAAAEQLALAVSALAQGAETEIH